MSLNSLILLVVILILVIYLVTQPTEMFKFDIPTMLNPNRTQLTFSQPGDKFNLATYNKENDDNGAWKSMEIAALYDIESRKYEWLTNDTFNFGGNTTFAMTPTDVEPPFLPFVAPNPYANL